MKHAKHVEKKVPHIATAAVSVTLVASLAASPVSPAFAAVQDNRYSGNQVNRAVVQRQMQQNDIAALKAQLDAAEAQLDQKNAALDDRKRAHEESSAAYNDAEKQHFQAEDAYAQAELAAIDAYNQLAAEVAAQAVLAQKALDVANGKLKSAQDNQAAKAAAVSDAQKKADETAKAYEKAKADASAVTPELITVAKNAVAEADAALKEAKAAAESAKKATSAANAEAQQAQRNLEAAKSGYDAAKRAQDYAATAEKQAKEELDKAQAAYEKAAAAANQDALAKADAAITSAKVDLSAASQEKKDKDAAAAEAQKALDAAEAQQEQKAQAAQDAKQAAAKAEQKKAEADKAKQAADSELAAAKQAATQLNADYADAQASEQKAKDAKEAAENNLSSAQAALCDANDKVAAAEEAYRLAAEGAEALKGEYLKGARGFFENAGYSAAIEILENAKYAEYTDPSKESDASYLANMKSAISVMRQINQLRKENGLEELKVSVELVAAAISDSNYNAYRYANDGWYGHADQFDGIAENIAYGNDPIGLWYTQEKANVAEAKEYYGWSDTPDTLLSSSQKDQISDYARALSKQVGHYLNIINPNYTVMGLAFAGLPGGKLGHYSNTFLYNASTWNKHVVSVGEYELALDSHLEKCDYVGAMTDAQAKLDDARELQAAKSSQFDKVEAAWKAADSAFAEAGKKTAAAKQAADDANSNVSSRQTEADLAESLSKAAQSEFEQAESNLNDANAAAEDASAQVVTRNSEFIAAKQQAEEAAERVVAKESAVTEAEQAKADLTEPLAAATKERDDKQAAYDARAQESKKANSDASSALEALGDAERKVADANNKRTQAQEAQASAEKDSVQAEARANEAQQSYDALLAQNAQLQAALEAAAKADSEAKASLAAAATVKSEADASVVEAGESVESCKQGLETAQSDQASVAAFDVLSEIELPGSQPVQSFVALFSLYVASNPLQDQLFGGLRALCADAHDKKLQLEGAERALQLAKAQREEDYALYRQALEERDATYAEYAKAKAAYEQAVAEREELAKREAEKGKAAAEPQATKAAYSSEFGQHAERASASPKTSDDAAGPIMAMLAGTALGGAIAARRKLRSAKHVR